MRLSIRPGQPEASLQVLGRIYCRTCSNFEMKHPSTGMMERSCKDCIDRETSSPSKDLAELVHHNLASVSSVHALVKLGANPNHTVRLGYDWLRQTGTISGIDDYVDLPLTYIAIQ